MCYFFSTSPLNLKRYVRENDSWAKNLVIWLIVIYTAIRDIRKPHDGWMLLLRLISAIHHWRTTHVSTSTELHYWFVYSTSFSSMFVIEQSSCPIGSQWLTRQNAQLILFLDWHLLGSFHHLDMHIQRCANRSRVGPLLSPTMINNLH